jgi:hypothetical protein
VIVPIAAYVAASEVLWRASEASFFYEGGKYAIATIFLCSMVRLRLRRINRPAMIYFLVLLPSIILTVLAVDLRSARGLISFNLSGPLALAVSVLYLSQIRLTPQELVRVLGIMLGPLLGLAVVCSSATFGAEEIQFTAESNMQTSAGAGPNQVSSVLGWGIICAFLWAAFQRRSLRSIALAATVMLVCAVQAALTFSRSGIYQAGICIMIAMCFLIRDPRTLVKMGVFAVLAVLLSWCVVYPALDSFTGGKLSERYAKKGFSNRESIAQQDMILFIEHPLLGVGPGMGKTWRGKRFGGGNAAHTEFTRLFSEHGVSGVVALFALVGMGLNTLRTGGPAPAKALRSTALAYSFTFMAVAAMRVAMPGFLFGLAFVRLKPETRRWSAAIRPRAGSAHSFCGNAFAEIKSISPLAGRGF